MPDLFRVALFQWDVKLEDFRSNLKTLDKLLCECVPFSPHCVVLPEMWTNSFCGTRLKEESEFLEERLESCANRAKQFLVWIAGTFAEPMAGKKVFNSLYLIDPSGKIRYKFRKMHIFPNTNEEPFFEPGLSIPKPFSSGNWKIGAGICFDLRFPEVFRQQMLEGANLFFVPSQFPAIRGEHFRLLSRSRALENLAYTVSVNRTGAEGELSFSGGSLAIEPFGSVICENFSPEGFEIATLDVQRVIALRKRHPFLPPLEK
ncbi:hypothetical protein HYY75_12065 [bacterium]|nr:hypothetical protein [bacterium]